MDRSLRDKILLKCARDAIIEELESSSIIDKSKIYLQDESLKYIGASFVTLNIKGELRGCIGSLKAHKPLLEDVIDNAKASAFRDPRFPPLSMDELSKISIEISILTSPKELKYESLEELRSKVVPFEDGVVLRYENKGATFLPQVWEQLPTFDLFFDNLCAKAALPTLKELKTLPSIEIYKCQKIEE